jgi:DNA repair exonuclease SbcCD nuclease subunit
VFSFVHCSDLHLDSPFAGVAEVDEEVAEVLQEATFEAFSNVVDLCLERSVDFLLVAGDVYDASERSLRAQLAFRDGLRKLAEADIRSFVVHGNHDPMDGWASALEWPEECHVFGASSVGSVPVSRDGSPLATVHGMSFEHGHVTENLARRFEANGEGLQIGLLHCNVGTDTGHEPYAPCTLDDLRETGMDYWALGHVHRHRRLSESDPCVVYAGATQGLHVNESGPHGCYVVEVDDEGRVTPEFVARDVVRWDERELRIDDLSTEDELLGALDEAVQRARREAEGRCCVCRVALEGRGPVHSALARSGYLDDLLSEMRTRGREADPLVWVDEIEDHTGRAIDLEERKEADDFVADLLRLAEEWCGSEEGRKKLKESLRPLYEHRRAGRHLEAPEGDELDEVLDRARELCLDRLLQEEGE